MPPRASYIQLHAYVQQAVYVAGLAADEAKRAARFRADTRAELVVGLDAAIRDLRAARRALTAEVRTCEVCGVEFLGRADARYHDDACRQRAHRARNT